MNSGANTPTAKSGRLAAMLISVVILGIGGIFVWSASGPSPRQSSPPAELKVGSPAPDFTLDRLDGGRLSLSELRGHPVILNLWATWCFPCREEMPAIEAIYHRYMEAGLMVVGLNLTSLDSVSDVRAFSQELGLTFPIVLDRDGAVSARYRFTGVPSTFFIDPNGILRSVIIGGPISEATIQSNVEALLEEQHR